MSYLDLSSINPALRELYSGQKVQNLVYGNNPFMALVPKKTDAGGKYYPVPTIWGVSQGRGAGFATAQANQTSTQLAEFLVTRKTDYSIATIDNHALKASAGDAASFLRGVEVLVDGAIRSATLSAASALFRSGTGSIGLIATGGITSGVITLDTAADVVQFEYGQTLQAAATDGGTPRAALGYVIARNTKLGTVTVASSGQGGVAATPSSWAAGDYLLVQSDSNAKIAGLPAWLPNTAPTGSDNFYGVNRSVDSRLYGQSYDGSAQTVEEAFIDHSLFLAREGAEVDHCITNYSTYAALIKALGAKVAYADLAGPASINFKGVRLNGANSEIKVIADRSCQAKAAFMLTLKYWQLLSLGEVPEIQTYGTDGQELLRVYNADAAECRVASYFALATSAPGFSGQTLLGV